MTLEKRLLYPKYDDIIREQNKRCTGWIHDLEKIVGTTETVMNSNNIKWGLHIKKQILGGCTPTHRKKAKAIWKERRDKDITFYDQLILDTNAYIIKVYHNSDLVDSEEICRTRLDNLRTYLANVKALSHFKLMSEFGKLVQNGYLAPQYGRKPKVVPLKLPDPPPIKKESYDSRIIVPTNSAQKEKPNPRIIVPGQDHPKEEEYPVFHKDGRPTGQVAKLGYEDASDQESGENELFDLEWELAKLKLEGDSYSDDPVIDLSSGSTDHFLERIHDWRIEVPIAPSWPPSSKKWEDETPSRVSEPIRTSQDTYTPPPVTLPVYSNKKKYTFKTFLYDAAVVAGSIGAAAFAATHLDGIADYLHHFSIAEVIGIGTNVLFNKKTDDTVNFKQNWWSSLVSGITSQAALTALILGAGGHSSSADSQIMFVYGTAGVNCFLGNRIAYMRNKTLR